jgi:hypothetical protein
MISDSRSASTSTSNWRSASTSTSHSNSLNIGLSPRLNTTTILIKPNIAKGNPTENTVSWVLPLVGAVTIIVLGTRWGYLKYQARKKAKESSAGDGQVGSHMVELTDIGQQTVQPHC